MFQVNLKLKFLFFLCLWILCATLMLKGGFLRGFCCFPIEGQGGFLGDIIRNPFRILLSTVVYAILLGVPVTIPLYISKCFVKMRFYKIYKLFWWITGLVFANLYLLLFNVEPHSGQYIFYVLFVLCLMAIVLIPTLVPAAYQNKTGKQQA